MITIQTRSIPDERRGGSVPSLETHWRKAMENIRYDLTGLVILVIVR